MKKNTVTKEIFSKRLRQLMEENGETTYSMADRFGLTSPTISRYMTGQMAAKITTIVAIAEYFGVDAAWLMGYDVPKHEKEEKSADLLSKAKHNEQAMKLLEYYFMINKDKQEIILDMVRGIATKE